LPGGGAITDKLDLIAAIYDAVIDPSGWDEAVKRIVEGTKSLQGNLVLQQPGAGSLTALYNVDPAIAEAYAQIYHKDDPLRRPEWRVAPGKVRECTYTQTETFKASAYYHEFVRPQGWASLVVAGLAHTPDSFALLALTRSPRAVWLDRAERGLLEAVAPHLARAARVHTLLARSRATANALAAATGFAVFLLSATCRVLFANREAEELVRAQAGVRYERGRLAAVTPALTHRLEALARAGSSPRLAEGDIGGTLELPRGEDRLPLLAHVIPLAASRAAALFDIGRPAAAVFVTDPEAGLAARIDRFAAQFGLTRAERRVLGEIIGGKGLPAAATKLKITELTARSHANRIFAKTGTARQTELIRRFFEASLPGMPGA
jgi:DNA-binding CsgD family transcriptional regulator